MTNNTEAANIVASIEKLPPRKQLTFWESFRKSHRRRVANGEAQLEPDLLRTVDAHIAKLKPLAAMES